MRKFLSIFACIALLFSVTSCEKEGANKLSMPKVSIEKYATGFTAKWDKVANAETYVYTIDGASEVTVKNTAVEFSNLENGNHIFKIKAVGAGFEDSDLTTVKVLIGDIAPDNWFVQDAVLRNNATDGNFKYMQLGLQKVLL